VKPGEVGEIVHRSPHLMLGYYRDEEKTAEAFRGGWFHSGDLATIDEEGFISVVDRKKDMIKSGGENVASREVEEAPDGPRPARPCWSGTGRRRAPECRALTDRAGTWQETTTLVGKVNDLVILCRKGKAEEACGMPRRLSRASVVRVFRPRSSVSSTGQSFSRASRKSQRSGCRIRAGSKRWWPWWCRRPERR
jgi:acyl-CoA synthetase (AMP-forming)/AMP-acid ligase II